LRGCISRDLPLKPECIENSIKQRPQQGAGTTAGILPKKGLARAEIIDFWSCRRRRISKTQGMIEK